MCTDYSDLCSGLWTHYSKKKNKTCYICVDARGSSDVRRAEREKAKKEQKQREKKKSAVKRSRVISFVCLCPLLLSHGILSLCALISGAVTGACSSELHLHFKHWGKWPAAARTRWHAGFICTRVHTHIHTLPPEHIHCTCTHACTQRYTRVPGMS